MRTVRTFLLAGVATCALAGPAALAADSPPQLHQMTIRLGDGTVEHIEYSGNVAPKVLLTPTSGPMDSFAFPTVFFAPDASFAALDRVSAAMDDEMASLMQEMQQASARPFNGFGMSPQVMTADMAPGSTGYSVISNWSGSGECMQSVQITSFGNGKKPQVVSRSSGNCKPGSATPSVSAPATAPLQQTDQGLLHNASWRVAN
jgi:hypothetical protein